MFVYTMQYVCYMYACTFHAIMPPHNGYTCKVHVCMENTRSQSGFEHLQLLPLVRCVKVLSGDW